MVPAEAYIYTRMDFRTALAHKDVTRSYKLTAESLNTQSLGITVATVFS